MVSPDEDFSPVGYASKIDYSKSFMEYKEMLTKDPKSTTYQRIFAKFDTALFGTEERDPGNEFIVSDGNYKAQVVSFKAKLRAEEAAAEKAATEEAANAEGNRTPPLPSSPTPPLQQPDHPISISVSSHTSRTIAVSTQVTTLVNSTTSPPEREVEREVTEAPPRPLRRQLSQSQRRKGSRQKHQPRLLMSTPTSSLLNRSSLAEL